MPAINKRQRLQQSRVTANKLANALDHELGRFYEIGPVRHEARCLACRMPVHISMVDGDFQISGPAVLDHCAPPIRPAARPLTVELALQLTPYTTIYHLTEKRADGTPRRYRLVSSVRRWARNPERFQFSLRHGIDKRTSIITDSDDLAQFSLDDPDTFRYPLT